MKSLVFDSGPIISLALSNLLWVIPELKKQFKGRFLIPLSVKKELIDNPLNGKKFKLEAIQLLSMVEDNIIEVVDDKAVSEKAEELIKRANSILRGYHHNINIMQKGEMEALALAAIYDADGIVVDERVTRTIIENPYGLKNHMERKLHTKLSVNKGELSKLSDELDDIPLIRSTELIAVAFEKGILDKYFKPKSISKKDVLEAALWSVKLRGCSITDKEIYEIIEEII